MSINKKSVITVIVCMCFFSLMAQAQQSVQIIGQATIDTHWKKPKTKERKKANTVAQVKALENFIQADPPKMRLYTQCFKSDIDVRIGEFINSFDVIRDDIDKAAKQYTVVIKANINTTHLDYVLESECKSASIAGGPTDKARISFVFFAREKVKSGGYKIPDGNIFIDAKIRQVFLNNTFKPISNNRLERADRRYKKTVMQQRYVETGEIDWLVVEEAVIRNGSDYFAFGAFQIRESTIDEESGLASSSVVVSAEIIDFADDSALGVAGPIQVRALGATADDAATEALKSASEKLAKAIVSQLNAQHKH